MIWHNKCITGATGSAENSRAKLSGSKPTGSNFFFFNFFYFLKCNLSEQKNVVPSDVLGEKKTRICQTLTPKIRTPLSQILPSTPKI